ncbi:MAG TPA: hypothetical protein VE090_04795 [Methylomirabilota bacterium]|nr:hypothetical protein [Methylomirabilota bacterium]
MSREIIGFADDTTGLLMLQGPFILEEEGQLSSLSLAIKYLVMLRVML